MSRWTPRFDVPGYLPGQWAYENATDPWIELQASLGDDEYLCCRCRKVFYGEEMHERFDDYCQQCGQQEEEQQ